VTGRVDETGNEGFGLVRRCSLMNPYPTGCIAEAGPFARPAQAD